MRLFVDAIYWAAITLSGVGYGDIHPISTSEVQITCIVMVVGLLAFAGVIMTGMSSIISNLDAQRGRFYNRMEAIRMHMTHVGLPEEVQTWVYKYYYYLWIHRKGNTIAGLWDDLPYTLRSEIATACHKPVLKKGSIFDGNDDGFLRALHAKLSTSTYSPGQILAKPGEVNKNAYYIENGLVQVYGNNEEKIATLLPGSFIGEVYLMFKIPRNTTISASTLCEICVLKHKDLISLLADYPEAGLKIARAARRRLHNVKYPLSEAVALGLASNPRNVIFHQNSNIDLKQHAVIA
ncbi:cyclic nucleotide-gated cation channel alpha-3-like [Alosa pseudoharengus]|uniref:cyclic nucleotide-gated cation channel alpha-3-like n=1 Tax=Alosa pseudoharengus TaxID=34774 RepID=UPI003F8AEA67